MRTLLFVLLQSVCMLAHAVDGQELLDRFLDDARTMTADFTQTLKTREGDVLQESKGRFFLDRPGRFRWDYELPYEQNIISDGNRIWVYDVALEQVTVQDQSTALSNTPMALIQDKKSVSEAFDIEQLTVEDGVFHMALYARSEQSDFLGIVLGIDEGGLRFMILDDHFDQRTVIEFSGVTLNRDIADDLFEFVPPEGADVFDGG